MDRYGMTAVYGRVHIELEGEYVQTTRSLCNRELVYGAEGVKPEEVCKDCLAIREGRRKRPAVLVRFEEAQHDADG